MPHLESINRWHLIAALILLITGQWPLRAVAQAFPKGIVFQENRNQIHFAGCARQPDGKIVLASTIEGTPDKQSTIVVRYTENGTRDDTFGIHGVASIQIPDRHSSATAILVQSDGKIVIGGHAYRAAKDSSDDVFLIRLLKDGNLDAAFNQRGWIINDLSGNHDHTYGMANDHHGNIFLVGESLRNFWWVANRYDFSAAKITLDGKLDEDFGDKGKTFVRVGSVSEDSGRAIAVSPDGSVILAGFSRHSHYPEFTVVKLTSAGILDQKFGSSGHAIYPLTKERSEATSLLVQGDGKILAGGFFETNATPQAVLMRLLNSGSLDKSFANRGMVIVGLQSQGSASVRSIALQNDGKIIAAGQILSGPNSGGIWVMRLHRDGEQDLSFGTRGATEILVPEKSARLVSMIALPNEKILLCGEENSRSDSWPYKRNGSFFLRLKPDGTLDETFPQKPAP